MLTQARWTANAYAAAARAPSTMREYRRCWKAWAAWCAVEGQSPLPASPENVANYVVARADAGDSVSTIRIRLAAISSEHREHGHASPTADSNVLRIVQGLVRVKAGDTPAQVTGLTAACVQRIEAASDMRSRIQRETVALCWVMRDALLRSSEVEALQWEDISVDRDGSGQLLIRRSKTDQSGIGHVAYLSRQAVTALARIRPKSSVGPVFPVQRRSIERRIRSAAARAGLIGRFRGHSPRVGMALDLAESGASLVELQQVGRWKSPHMPAMYIRGQEARRGAVARFYGRG